MALCVRVCMLSVCLSVCLSFCLSTHAFVFGSLLHSSLSCEGCDPGMYLTTNDTCLPCTANSNSTQSGAFVCPCFEGYYRAAGEPPEIGCTRKSCAGVCLLGVYGISFVHHLLPSPKCSIFTIAVCAYVHSRQRTRWNLKGWDKELRWSVKYSRKSCTNNGVTKFRMRRWEQIVMHTHKWL